MGEVGAAGSLRQRAFNIVANTAAYFQKIVSSACGNVSRWRIGWQTLCRFPLSILLGWQGDHPKLHKGVWAPAIFGTDTEEVTCLVGLDIQIIAMPGYHIPLPAQLRHPETVNDIVGNQI